jgi:hypothetical protein
MANRKQLKKSINMICGELFADCVALCMCSQGNNEKYSLLMAEVLNLRADFVARISHADKLRAAFYFKKLREDFTTKVNDLSERIVNA